MTVAHAHSHGEPGGNYFLDQLFTILLCGALGIAAVAMYFNEPLLIRILVPAFFVPVLAGGLVLLALVAIRGIAVWQLAGAAKSAKSGSTPDHGHAHSHGNSHAHDENCGHDHGHAHAHSHAADPAHAEGDEHDHSWVPVRYLVLAVPFFLFILGEPRRAFSTSEVRGSTGGGLSVSPKRQALAFLAGGPSLTRVLKKSEVDQRILQLRFKELVEAAAIQALHETYEGDIGLIRGQFMAIPGNDSEFTLFRVDRTCCISDQIILDVRIASPLSVQSLGLAEGEWVSVRGVIAFERDEKKKKWVPVLQLQKVPNAPQLKPDSVSPAQPTNDTNTV